MYMTPQIACLLCHHLVSCSAAVKYPKGIPAARRHPVGMIIAWGSNLFALARRLSVKGVGDAFASFGFFGAAAAFGQVVSGFKFLGIILVRDQFVSTIWSRRWTRRKARTAGDEISATAIDRDGVVS